MKKQKNLAGLQKRKAVSGYIFISPFIIGFLMFMVKPFFQSLYMSFCNVVISPQGFKNEFAAMEAKYADVLSGVSLALNEKRPACAFRTDRPFYLYTHN